MQKPTNETPGDLEIPPSDGIGGILGRGKWRVLGGPVLCQGGFGSGSNLPGTGFLQRIRSKRRICNCQEKGGERGRHWTAPSPRVTGTKSTLYNLSEAVAAQAKCYPSTASIWGPPRQRFVYTDARKRQKKLPIECLINCCVT